MQVKPSDRSVCLSVICTLEYQLAITSVSGFKRVLLLNDLAVSKLRTLSDIVIDEAHRCR